ncbi:transposable element Tcb2 transposase [Trichonephila clavipes]|nr:transposable element Tcb2 transposase [Trichonephila clavipes]
MVGRHILEDKSRKRPRQTSRREQHNIVRNSGVQPTASSAAIQTQVEPSLVTPVSFRTLLKRLAGHLGPRRSLLLLPLTPSHRRVRLEWCRARGNWTSVEWSLVLFSDDSRFNSSSDDNRVDAQKEKPIQRQSCSCVETPW